MKIAVIDDYQDSFRTLNCYKKLSGHDVIVYKDTEKDAARLADRLKDAEALILTQQRSRLPRAVIERLPNLKLVNQTEQLRLKRLRMLECPPCAQSLLSGKRPVNRAR